jgi:hypothetical protein
MPQQKVRFDSKPMAARTEQNRSTIPNRYRTLMVFLLSVFGIAYLVGWVVDQTIFLPALSVVYFLVAFSCWRGSRGGFALATSFAFIGLFGVALFFVLNVLGLFNPVAVDSVLIGYSLLQLPLAFLGLRAYEGARKWPLLLVIMGCLLLSSSYIQNSTASYLAPTIDVSHPVITTLSQILNSTFRSALDKYGVNGIVVEVINVSVVEVFGALDGDWHVVVKDTNVKLFITEILPRDQARLNAPKAGARIVLIGIVYWDDDHVGEAWHGYTGWEIHPVLSWYAIS